MEKFYTYILVSEKSGRFYIGHTSNLDERLSRHNSGAVPSTRSKGPWKLVYLEEYGNRKDASNRESQIKNRKSRIYIQGLIKSKELETRPDFQSG